MQTIEELAATIAYQLHAVYDDPLLCEQYAWWILEAILAKGKASLIADDGKLITVEQSVRIDDWLHKLIVEKMPLAYLIGSVPFNDLTILVEPPVLIPRPETEEWTVYLIEQLKKLDNKKLTILDLCTGTGCIALAIAKALPMAHVYAVDIADEAMQCAQKNIVHSAASNVVLIQSDLFDALPDDVHFDLIVGNPPYISQEYWEDLDEQVAEWEDKRALIAENGGLAIIATIIAKASAYLKENSEMSAKHVPQLLLEIDRNQAKDATELMKQAHFCDIAVLRDLEGKDRVITGRYASCGPFGD
jgi:release factor glutamine methyltransferase